MWYIESMLPETVLSAQMVYRIVVLLMDVFWLAFALLLHIFFCSVYRG